MTELDDLRSTLDEQAAKVSDRGLTARPTAIHHRVNVVRRRRRAALAGSAAAVLAVVGSVALRSGESQGPVPPEAAATIVGVTPPDELTSLGYTYTFERGVEGDGDTAVLDLPESDRPRLISWATEGKDDTVTVTTGGPEEQTTYRSTDFSDFVLFPEGNSGRVKVTTADGSRAGLASYTVDLDSPPPGVSKDGITFREQIAGLRLITAKIGDPGVTDLTIDLTSRGPRTGTSMFCSSAPEGAVLHVDLDNGPKILETDCDGVAPMDVPMATTSLSEAGQTRQLRAYLTDGEDGPIIEDGNARIGIAAYDDPPSTGTGTFERESPEFTEYRGHLYQRAKIIEVPRGRRQSRVELETSDTPTLAVGYSIAAPGSTTVRFQASWTEAGGSLSGFDVRGNSGLGLINGPDPAVEFSQLGSSAPDPRTRAAVITYTRAD